MIINTAKQYKKSVKPMMCLSVKFSCRTSPSFFKCLPPAMMQSDAVESLARLPDVACKT